MKHLSKTLIITTLLLLLTACQAPIRDTGMMNQQSKKFKESPLNAIHGEATPGIYNTADDLRR